MSLRYGRKISDLTPLTASSNETYVLGIDGDTSYKLPAIVFQTAVGESSLGVVNSRLNSLEGASGSYLKQAPIGTVSSSAQLTSSYDNRYTLNGALTYTTWANISNIPLGIVSASSQIIGFEQQGRGILSGSIPYNTLTGIPNGIVSSSSQILGGSTVLSGSISYQSLTDIPSGIVSGSSQLTALNEFTQSYYTDSGSFDTRLNQLETYGDIDPIKYSGSSIYTVTPEAGPSFNTDDGIFFGSGSANNASNANYSIFLGYDSGKEAQYAQSAVFIGDTAGREAANADNSVFIGIQSGHLAENANSSVFIGNSAGHDAFNASEAIFLGPSAGENAYNASHAIAIGWQAGYGAQNAEHSVLLGFQAGKTVSGTGIGPNNVIIGNNVTLPENYSNYVNLGNVLFISGTYSQLLAYDPITHLTDGKVGINNLNPEYTFDVSGSIAATEGLYGTIYADNGVISSSQQITDFGFVTGSYTEVTIFNSYTQSYYIDSSSIDNRLTNVEALTAAGVPYGTISGSQQITSLGFVSGSYEETGRGILSGSISYTDLTNIPSGLVSESVDITSLNQFTQSYYTDSASFDTRIGELNTAIQSGVPAGTVSGSQQITTLGFVSGSYETTGRNILSGSISYNTLTDIPIGIASGSYETTGRSILSSSAQITSFGFVSGSYETTGRGILSSSQQILNYNIFATTGSNTLQGTQTFSGSIYVTGNVTIYGTSSLQYVTASAVSLGTNMIYLNTATPAVRYAGIAVYDSGSSGKTGSLLWDSQNNNWIYQNPEGSGYASAKFIAGPTSSVLGSEIGLTTGRLTVAQADDHISSSQITDNGTTVTIPGTLVVNNGITGEIRATNGVISGSSQITASLTLDKINDVQDYTAASITNGYNLSWNSSTTQWEPTAGAAAKGNIRLFVAEKASNSAVFYFNAITVTSLSSASPNIDTAFMVTSNLLSKVTLYLRSDQASSNSTRVDLYRNPAGMPFASATSSLANGTNTLTQYNILTYTFSGLTLNQFDSIHMKVTPTSNPGNLYGIVTIE